VFAPAFAANRTDESSRADARDVGPYQLFILCLCIWAILSLRAQVAMPVDSPTSTILLYADTVVCGIFLIDFLRSLYRAPNRIHYLATWGWLDLLSSVPTIGPLRLARAGRIVRILRVIRGVKSARTIARFVLAKRAKSAFLASLLLALLLLVVCSISVLHFETAASGANIRSAEDAMWWAMSTMTTVGYGDRFPVTSEGRVVAVFLMVAGVGVFGTFSGLVASWFLAPGAEGTDAELAQIRRDLAALSGQISQRSGDQSRTYTGSNHLPQVQYAIGSELA